LGAPRREGKLEVTGRTRIAFVELWRLGDAVAATAGLLALRTARPDADIAIVAHPDNGEPLFRLLPDATHIPFAAFWTRGKLARDKYLPWTIDHSDVWRVRRQLNDFSADSYVLFRGDVREHVFFSTLRRAKVVDYAGRFNLFPWVQTMPRPRQVPRFREYVHLVKAWTTLNVSAEPCLAGIPVSDTKTRSFVLIHPGASWRFKQWREDNFVELIRRLMSVGVPVKLVGSADDAPLIRRIGDKLPQPVDFILPSLEQFYYLVAAAKLVICNNSAALHIAEALDTPCIAITGPSDPIRWGTYKAHSRTIEKSVGLPCHPCGEKRCVRPTNPCIDEIRVDDVFRAVTDLGLLNS